MELRELAEQVLFGTSLADKLGCPDEVTDERPGSAREAPVAPGRPATLKFKGAGEGSSGFPGVRGLEKTGERARLLHFFANHELLATELMALVLLRFPDAPPAFRQGVFKTLRDEQAHTRLYVERMRAGGVEFGDLPVSGYFWRSVAPMSNPIDFVAGLSLTFEQANLDFCREYATAFAAVGDAETSRLLEGIYRDEIAHVAHGLKWFRRWKNPAENDWEAFCRQLKFPLSPQRAKGPVFNSEGRRAAGLDPEFIRALEVFARSRGRTPGIFLFNPFCEASIAAAARGQAFQPTRDQQAFVNDLGSLAQFLCRRDDVVLVPVSPSGVHQSTLQTAGFPIPEFVQTEKGRIPAGSPLTDRKLGKLRPWAWGPDSVECLEPLAAQVTGEDRSVDQWFNPGIAGLYSKAWSASFFRGFLEAEAGITDARGPAVPLCSIGDIGVAVDSVAAALEVVARIRSGGHHRVVVKEALGFAGTRQLRLWEPELLPAQWRWMESAIDGGATLVIEPWLDRIGDFSIQLEMESGVRGLRLVGFTGLVNDLRGQFQANWADADWDRRVPAGILALWDTAGVVEAGERKVRPGLPGVALTALVHRLIRRLEPELRRLDLAGPVGIDALVYRDPERGVRLKPVVEINPRYTMGRLTLELMNQVAPGVRGVFRLVSKTAVERAGFDSFAGLADRLGAEAPLRRAGDPVEKIVSGTLCLNDPARAERVLAVFEVGRDVDPHRPVWERTGATPA
jgi:hypothetical protein